MTAKHPLHRQDQTIELGPRHGYRIDGDHVFINADLHVPQGFGGEVALELWAAQHPHREGPLSGTRVAELALELPTPIGSYIHHVDTRIAARLPLQGRAHDMVLALVERGADGQESVHASATYADPQTFIAPRFEGTVGYRVEGQDVHLQVDGIFNPRASSNLSGTLSVELWAFPASESGPSIDGVRLAAAEVEPLGGQSDLRGFEQRVAFDEPPAGRYQLALLLCEWTHAGGYVARDRRDFERTYERSAPELAPSAEAQPPVAVATAARPAERLRLVPPVVTESEGVAVPAPAVTPAPTVAGAPTPAPAVAAAPAPVVPAAPAPAVAAAPPPIVAAPPVVAAAPAAKAATAQAPAVATAPAPAAVTATAPAPSPAPGPVSIQTGTVEELAAVKGLTLKLAKEIVKARPFASLADLVRVRGIGDKSLVRLKGLLKL